VEVIAHILRENVVKNDNHPLTVVQAVSYPRLPKSLSSFSR
jgi:hypothetical protein